MAKKPNKKEMNRLIKEMEELAEAKKWETLKAKAETFIKKFPDDAMGYFFLGSSKSELGDFSEGLDNLDQAIRKKPKNANFYNNRGSIKDNLGRLEEAIEDLDKAIALDPNSSFSFFNRGTIKYKLGRYNEAIEDLDKAIALDPNDPRFYHNRAMAIGKKAAKESEAKITAAYDAQLKQFSDPQKIIELYEDEINRSSLRTYGTKSFTTQEEHREKKQND
ncbi:MAG: tetratricopeptide repeat protein [Candidatus Puniceispirillaceae bacterium]